MLSITLDSSCDVCIEEFGKEQKRRPRVLPCGHVLCASCTSGIFRTAPQGRALCPFCRQGFNNESAPFLRVDAHAPASSSVAGSSSGGGDKTRALVYRRREPTPEEEEEVAHRAFCNLCLINLKGVRHKCLTCPDYDVCDMCISVVQTHHPYHAFVEVTTAQNLIGTLPAPRPEHQAWCDNCKNRIRGIRYKCAHALCPDYDLCEDCEALPIPVHPHDHPMLKVRQSDTVLPEHRQALVGGNGIPLDRAHMRELLAIATAMRRT